MKTLSTAINAAKLEQLPGRCMFCDAKLVGIRRYVCAELACTREYDRTYGQGYKAHARKCAPVIGMFAALQLHALNGWYARQAFGGAA